MAFYTERWIICNMSDKDVFLARRKLDNIILERIVGESSIKEEKILGKDILVEYDIDFNPPKKIYLLYQDKERNLILNVIEEDNMEEVKLTPAPIGEVAELNIKVQGKEIHILYIIKASSEENEYNIYHHYYNGKSWEDFIVEKIVAKKVLNPIKVIKNEANIILAYYRKDNEIVIREFNPTNRQWSKGEILTNTDEEKLFIDMIKLNDTIHTAYCEYEEGSLEVKYKALAYSDGAYSESAEETISNPGSPSYPNLILYSNKLWLTWVELNKIISRSSEDGGKTWGPILQWDDSRTIDFLRYKYLTMVEDNNIKLDFSFGSISPTVKLMGFGPKRNTREIPLKKSQWANIPRI